ncbi:periplasmic binding protein-like II, partial [Neocallimastix sp. 'constans']
MKYILIYFLIFQNLLLYLCETVKLNSVVLAFSPEDKFFQLIEKDFNNYAIENSLDIQLNVTLYTFNNSLDLENDYRSTIEYIQNNDSTKYDIYFFDIIYSSKYYEILLELDDVIPESHFLLYSSGIAPYICKYNGKWIGLPVDINYRILYSNMDLLNKYEKKLPKTWEEMLNIGNEILKEERANGNNELIGYNGFIPDYENYLSSVEEFIFSFRNNITSHYPGYDSTEAQNALKKLKQIKNDLSSNEAFRSNDSFSIEKLTDGKAIFIKYWFFQTVNKVYKKSILPGNIEGISGSTIGGYNIGINNKISNNRKEKAIEVFKYITSWDIQKKYLIENHILSAIKELYDDEEVCRTIECEEIKNTQSFYHKYNDKYYKKFKEYIYKFLYGDLSVEEVLKKIRTIGKIYIISVNPKESIEGFIMFLITLFNGCMMIFLIRFLFDIRFKVFFQFLNINLWLLTIFGDIIILLSIIPEYGLKTSFKCQLKHTLLPFGFIITMIPILYQLITNYQEDNKFCVMVKKYKFIITLTLIGIAIILTLLNMISKYDIIEYVGNNDKNFQWCKINSIFRKITLLLIFEVIGIIFLIMTIFIFYEWNIDSTKREMRLFNLAICLDYIFLALFVISYSANFENYSRSFLFSSVILNLIALTNYFLVYGSNI